MSFCVRLVNTYGKIKIIQYTTLYFLAYSWLIGIHTNVKATTVWIDRFPCIRRVMLSKYNIYKFIFTLHRTVCMILVNFKQWVNDYDYSYNNSSSKIWSDNDKMMLRRNIITKHQINDGQKMTRWCLRGTSYIDLMLNV